MLNLLLEEPIDELDNRLDQLDFLFVDPIGELDNHLHQLNIQFVDTMDELDSLDQLDFQFLELTDELNKHLDQLDFLLEEPIAGRFTHLSTLSRLFRSELYVSHILLHYWNIIWI